MRYETCNPGQDNSATESQTYPSSNEEAILPIKLIAEKPR